MDEVDKTLITQLKEIGCHCCDEDVNSIQDLSPEQVMSCALRCLILILPEEKRESIPNDPGSNVNMATKYNLASYLTTSCKELGFRGDLGYQSFLYGSDADIRRVFLFLIEKLPRDQSHGSPKKSLSLEDRIKRSSDLTRVWMPPVKSKVDSIEEIATVSLSNMINSRSVVLNKINPVKRRYYDKYLEIPFHDLASIISWNRRQLAASSSSSPYSMSNIPIKVTREKPEIIPRSRSKPKLGSSPSKESTLKVTIDTAAESAQVHQENIEELKERTPVEVLQDEIKNELKELKEAEERVHLLQKLIRDLDSALKEENITLLELKSRNLTIEELRQLTQDLELENEELKTQWNTFKTGLQDEIASLTKEASKHELELQEVKKILNSRRRDINIKEQMIKDLTAKIPNPFPPTRNAYTKRIMEILNNIKKLNVDTKKVILDTRSLQKEITSLTGKVQRSFSVADETVFSSAKQKTDEFSKKSYKLLAQVHEETNRLSQGIESCGVTRRDVIGLEESVQKQQGFEIDSKLQKIQADILQVKQSNQQLVQQIQGE